MQGLRNRYKSKGVNFSNLYKSVNSFLEVIGATWVLVNKKRSEFVPSSQEELTRIDQNGLEQARARQSRLGQGKVGSSRLEQGGADKRRLEQTSADLE